MKTLAGFLIVLAANSAWSEEWMATAASTAALRTYGAVLVSSDSVTLDEDRLALITYWEAPRGKEDRDYYRCVDIVSESFAEQSQQCWSVKTPSGRRAIVK